MTIRERMEPRDTQPLQEGLCDWCGEKTEARRTYCNADCRVAYNNLLGRQGKSVMQMLKLWRKYRGRKGTPGEGMIGDIASRVDQMLAEDRDRKATRPE